MNQNKFEIYIETLKKQVIALQDGMDLMMTNQPNVVQVASPTPEMKQVENQLQQEKELRVKAESIASEIQRKFEEAVEELAKEREAHLNTKRQFADTTGIVMQKDEVIAEQADTIENLENTIKELKQQLLVKNEVPAPTTLETAPVVNDPTTVVKNPAPMKKKKSKDGSFKMIIRAPKECSNCPLFDKCSQENRDSSLIGRGCGLLEQKNAAIKAEEVHVKVATEKGKLVADAYTKDGLFLGEVKQRTETMPLLNELRKHRNGNKTVIFNTSLRYSGESSIFTTLNASISEVLTEAPKVDTVEIGEVVDMEELEETLVKNPEVLENEYVEVEDNGEFHIEEDEDEEEIDFSSIPSPFQNLINMQ